MKKLGGMMLGLALATPAFAQTAARAADARQAHYQIGVMERVLEGAVEHGAAILKDRLQAVAPDAPAELIILDIPRVRGFMLDGYGVFFDVEVPSLNGTLTWSLRTLQGAPGQTAAPVVASGGGPTPTLPNPRRFAGGTAPAPDRPVTATSVQPAPAAAAKPAPGDDRILDNPNEAYRAEVVEALVDAMLDYSGPLAIADGEWLTIAARGIQDRPRIGPPDNDAQTVMIRVRGSDLSAFRMRQMTRDEVIKRVEQHVF